MEIPFLTLAHVILQTSPVHSSICQDAADQAPQNTGSRQAQGNVHEVQTREQREGRAMAAMQKSRLRQTEQDVATGQGNEDSRPRFRGLGNSGWNSASIPTSPSIFIIHNIL